MSCSVRTSICSPTGQAFYPYVNTIHGYFDFACNRLGSEKRKYVKCQTRCVASKSIPRCSGK